MTLKIGVPYNGASTATVLNAGDNYILPAGVVVNTSATGVAIFGANHVVTVEGVLIAALDAIVTVPPPTVTGLSIKIAKSGVVASQISDGIRTLATPATIVNEGLVTGSSGIFCRDSILTNTGRIIAELEGINATGTITNGGEITSYSGSACVLGAANVKNSGSITAQSYGLDVQAGATVNLSNTGTIASEDRAVYARDGSTVTVNNSGAINAAGITFATSAGARIELTNTGTITSTTTLSFFGDTGIDKVTNKGIMRGDVRLSGNNDLYEGNGGRVIGKVEGQSGNDTMRGGTLADKLDGGTENDTLVGRGGNDTLTGGAGLDKFYFSVAPNSVANKDTITDFNITDDTIHLSKAVFAAITQNAGTMQSKFYWESTTGLAHDSDDRIIYNTTTGVLNYDSNGTAAGGALQIAVLSNKATIGTTLSNADFIIF